MPTNQSIIQARYDAKNSKIYSLKFSRKYDADVIEKLEQVESRNGYIKQLIKDDTARNSSAGNNSVNVSMCDAVKEMLKEESERKIYLI